MPEIEVNVNDTVLRSVISRMPTLTPYIIDAATTSVFNSARQDVPVDTGALRASISREVQGNVGYVRASMHYAAYVEYGTSNPNYPAQPYLRPAVKKVQWLKILRQAFRRVGL